MARTNKNLERTMMNANVKAGYITQGKFGSFIVYSFICSTFGKVCIGLLLLTILCCFV